MIRGTSFILKLVSDDLNSEAAASEDRRVADGLSYCSHLKEEYAARLRASFKEL